MLRGEQNKFPIRKLNFARIFKEFSSIYLLEHQPACFYFLGSLTSADTTRLAPRPQLKYLTMRRMRTQCLCSSLVFIKSHARQKLFSFSRGYFNFKLYEDTAIFFFFFLVVSRGYIFVFVRSNVRAVLGAVSSLLRAPRHKFFVSFLARARQRATEAATPYIYSLCVRLYISQ